MNITNAKLGEIGEAIVKDWLEQNAYPFVDAGRAMWFIDNIVGRDSKVTVHSLVEFVNETRKLFSKEELGRIKVFCRTLREINPRLGGSLKSYGSFFPDFLAKMPELTFIEVKVNKSKLAPGQKKFLDLAKKCGFATKVARISIKISTEFSMVQYP